jgi:hypothetical protein
VLENNTISFIVPTTGRQSVLRTVASIESNPDDEVLVIQHNPPSGNWGNNERQEGVERARCAYLAFIDDDDVYVPHHRELMSQAIQANQEGYPIMFRMKYPNGRVIWDEKKIECGNIGAPMFLVPNVKENLHIWEPFRSAADFIFADKWTWPAKLTIWREEIIALLGHNDEKYENNFNYREAKKRGLK